MNHAYTATAAVLSIAELALRKHTVWDPTTEGNWLTCLRRGTTFWVETDTLTHLPHIKAALETQGYMAHITRHDDRPGVLAQIPPASPATRKKTR